MKGFRTLALNAVTFVALVTTAAMPYIEGIGLDPMTAARVGMGIAVANTVANFILRFKTDSPVGKSQ